MRDHASAAGGEILRSDQERVLVFRIAGSSMQGVRCVYMDRMWHCVYVWHMSVSSQDTVCGHLIRQRSTFLYLKLCLDDRYPVCLHVLACAYPSVPLAC